MQTPSYLSRYWITKRWTITRFLVEATYDPNGVKSDLQDWFNDITTPDDTSPEDKFDKALAALRAARTAATNGSGNTRRSARLVRMVQGLIGAREAGGGFHTEVGETYLGTEVSGYKEAVRNAAVAAADFLAALKDDADEVVLALDDLLENNPGITPEIWKGMNSLRRAMKASLASQPGSGEGSGPWPSITLTSSSSSSSSSGG